MKSRLVVAGVALGLIAAFFYFDLGTYVELDYLKQRQANFAAYVAAQPLKSAAAYFLVYVAVAALSLPGAAVLTLVGGAVFGLLWGTLIVSFASTLGATCAFVLSRYLFRDAIGRRFADRMRAINKGMEEDGAFYLFSLRLVPLFPFFVINLVMGLTAIKVGTYYFVSQIGMLPATAVFVNAGTQLAKIESLGDALSPGILASFTALGLFPLIARMALKRIKAHRVLKPFEKPRRFDSNLVVIGAGSAGLVAAYIAAATKARVTLIEKNRMGGDCLNTGCVPSKALLRSAKIVHLARHGGDYGVGAASLTVDFRDVMARVKRVVATIAPHDSVERYTRLGVECLSGDATIVSPYAVRVGDREITTRSIIVAAGARPFIPPIPGLENVDYLTSDTLWEIEELPKRLVVLGGGPIGCEIAQAFARLGARVTQIEMAERLLMREDEPVSDFVRTTLAADGVEVALNYRATAFRREGAVNKISCEFVGEASSAQPLEIEFDRVVVAVGRRARTSGYGLEDIGVEIADNGTITTDEFLSTNFPNIFACGDVTGPYQFTHTASHQAWYATVNSLFGMFKRFAVDYSVIPWCTFTDPEVAHVGLNELEAKERGVEYELTEYALEDLDRAIADETGRGFVRILTVPKKDKILGACIVGEHAGDLLAEFVLAMKHGLGLNKILGTIHSYPTLAEANKASAGVWRREHTPVWALTIARRLHEFNRRA